MLMNLTQMQVQMELGIFLHQEVVEVYTLSLPRRGSGCVLITTNANDNTTHNYYIFKDIKSMRDYLALCEYGTTFGT